MDQKTEIDRLGDRIGEWQEAFRLAVMYILDRLMHGWRDGADCMQVSMPSGYTFVLSLDKPKPSAMGMAVHTGRMGQKMDDSTLRMVLQEGIGRIGMERLVLQETIAELQARLAELDSMPGDVTAG